MVDDDCVPLGSVLRLSRNRNTSEPLRIVFPSGFFKFYIERKIKFSKGITDVPYTSIHKVEGGKCSQSWNHAGSRSSVEDSELPDDPF